MKTRDAFLIGAAIALIYVVFFGGRGSAFGPIGLAAGAVALLPGRREVRDALGDAFERYGFPRAWGEALSYVESRWRVGAIGDQGRSVGPTQIQKRTLANNGFTGDPLALTRDAQLAADWTARLCLAGAKNAEGRTLRQTPTTAADLAAWWNAGRQSFAELPDDHETRTDYEPKLAAALASIGEGTA